MAEQAHSKPCFHPAYVRVLCAVNMTYSVPEATVAAGDEVAFFPPVTGG